MWYNLRTAWAHCAQTTGNHVVRRSYHGCHSKSIFTCGLQHIASRCNRECATVRPDSSSLVCLVCHVTMQFSGYSVAELARASVVRTYTSWLPSKLCKRPASAKPPSSELPARRQRCTCATAPSVRWAGRGGVRAATLQAVCICPCHLLQCL